MHNAHPTNSSTHKCQISNATDPARFPRFVNHNKTPIHTLQEKKEEKTPTTTAKAKQMCKKKKGYKGHFKLQWTTYSCWSLITQALNDES